jgi:hypothetical protein
MVAPEKLLPEDSYFTVLDYIGECSKQLHLHWPFQAAVCILVLVLVYTIGCAYPLQCTPILHASCTRLLLPISIAHVVQWLLVLG